MGRNLNQVFEYFDRTKETCELFIRRPLGNGSRRAMISPTKPVFAFQGLEHWNIVDLGLGEPGPRRNGRMEQNFPNFFFFFMKMKVT